MKLYCVTNASSYPMQCCTVSDSKEKADKICERIKRKIPHIAGCVYVERVDSFYPAHMTEPNHAIIKAMESV